jgi:hypothetical protein
MGLHGPVKITQGGARLDVSPLRAGVYLDSFRTGKIDHHAIVTNRVAGDMVASTGSLAQRRLLGERWQLLRNGRSPQVGDQSLHSMLGERLHKPHPPEPLPRL